MATFTYLFVQDEVLTVVGMVGLSQNEICGGYLGKSCGASYDPWNQTWSVVVPGNKPPVKPIPLPKVSFKVVCIFLHCRV